MRRNRTEPTETGAALAARSLSKSFGDRIAVAELDIEIRHGEFVGLLGPNGAGKTTTVGMFTTRVKPTAGGASVNGVDVTTRPEQVKRMIGVLPQKNTLDRSLDVRDNLRFHGLYFGMSRGETDRVAARLLDRFGLADHAEAQVAHLSGGLAQRLMLARAVMHGPRILFLDEPTSGLDPQGRRALWDVVRELNGAGQTVLLTTHDMEEADALCDRVAIMNRGRLVAVDTPTALKESVGHPTAITLSAHGDVQALAQAVRAAVPDNATVTVHDGQVRLILDAGRRHLADVVQAADRAGFGLTDVTVETATLETVFIELTGQELQP